VASPEAVADGDADRWLALDGASNVRDLGGWPAGDAVVRTGRVFRGDSLDGCSTGDVDELVGQRGVACVIDLRSPREVADPATVAWASRVPVISCPLLTDLGKAADPLRGTAGVDLADFYMHMATAGQAHLVTALRAIATHCDRPLIFHCAAGKDRTGVVAALLLGILGAPDEDIVADYALTETRMPAVIRRLSAARTGHRVRELPPEVIRAVPATMRRFLARLAVEHGSAAEWARGAGLEPVHIDTLREELLLPV
jgi:protein tyrosine/serine phosphatase